MKKVLSVILCLVILSTVFTPSLPTANASEEKITEYTTVFDENYTEWTSSVNESNNKITFTNPNLSENTMFLTSVGTISKLDGYPYSSAYASSDKISLTDAAKDYPEIDDDTSISETLAVFKQNINAHMFRMKNLTSESFSAGDTIRVTFKIYATDICSKGINYAEDGTTILDPVKDDNIKNLTIKLTPQNAGSAAGSAVSTDIEVNKWITVCEEIPITQTANGIRLDFDNATATKANGYITPFAATVFYDGNFKVEKLTEVTLPTDTVYSPVFNVDYTSWTSSVSDNNKITFKNPDSTSNTMFFTSVGSISELTGYPTSSAYCHTNKISLTEAAKAYPGVDDDPYITSTLAVAESNINAQMFRMSTIPGTDFVAGDKVRVTFRMYATDIYAKGVNYAEDGTTAVNPTIDNTIETLDIQVISQNGTKSSGVTNNVTIPVNQWVTVSEEFTLTAATNGFRMNFKSATATGKNGYTTPFAGKVFYDGHFKVEKLVETTAPIDNGYYMISRLSLGSATSSTDTAGSSTTAFAKTKSSYNASNGGKASEKSRTNPETNEIHVTATQSLVTGIKPYTIANSYYGIDNPEVTSSGMIAKLTRSAPCSMIRLKDVLPAGTLKSGERIKMKAWIYLADVYKKSAVESPTAADAIKDDEADSEDLRFIFCNNSASSNSDGIVESFNVPTNVWTQVELSGTVDTQTDAVGFRIDQGIESSFNVAYGQAYAGTVFFGDIEVYKAPEKLVDPLYIPNAFGSDMLFQRNAPINVWGYHDTEGTEITVTLGEETKIATVKNGRFDVSFSPLKEQEGLTLTFSCDDSEDVVFENIAIGELILASGQSNMSYSIGSTRNIEDIKSDNVTASKIRMLSMSRTGHLEAQTEIPNGKWQVCTTGNIGARTAVGYITAYNIAKEYNIPVGVIDASLGGANVQTFLSDEVLKTREMYEEVIQAKATQKTLGNPENWKQYPTGLYNTMLYPIKGMTIGSLLWYQGRSTVTYGDGTVNFYPYLQHDFFNMVRDYFNNDTMPIVVCDLAPYTSSAAMEMRQMQQDETKRDPNGYLVTVTDVGPLNSDTDISGIIHPSEKRPIGDRCALILKHAIFGYEEEYSSPLYDYMEIDGNKAIIHLTHADGLKLVSNHGEEEIMGFEISEDEQTYVEAKAEIDGTNVIVYADGIEKPVAVRYCWQPFAYYDADGVFHFGRDSGLGQGKFTTNSTLTIATHLGGNLENGIDLPLAPFIATLEKPSVVSAIKSGETDKEISIQINVKNSGYNGKSQKLIVCVYNGLNLSHMQMIDTNFKTIDQKDFDLKIDKSFINGESEIKLFIWENMTTVKPYHGSVDVSLAQ